MLYIVIITRFSLVNEEFIFISILLQDCSKSWLYRPFCELLLCICYAWMFGLFQFRVPIIEQITDFPKILWIFFFNLNAKIICRIVLLQSKIQNCRGGPQLLNEFDASYCTNDQSHSFHTNQFLCKLLYKSTVITGTASLQSLVHAFNFALQNKLMFFSRLFFLIIILHLNYPLKSEAKLK